MSAIYHNSEDGPRRCKALKGNCPYAKAGQPHFSNVEEAQVAYEVDLEAKMGSVYADAVYRKSAVKQKSIRQKVYSSYYGKLDRGEISPAQDRSIRAMRAFSRGTFKASKFGVRHGAKLGFKAAQVSSRLSSQLTAGLVKGRLGTPAHNIKLQKLKKILLWEG